ncbi:MAG TPA: hypothetical protein VMS71_08255 [Candidatus Acidoferrum sp.]|nr:hypothetical protein [Candidatus Acidoferrum sp.]
MDSLMTVHPYDLSTTMLIKKLVIVGGILLLIGFWLYLRFRRWQLWRDALEQRSEAFNRLLEKFGTAREFLDFLQTENGRRLFEDPLLLGGHPILRVLGFVKWGIISFVLGLVPYFAILLGVSDIGAIGKELGIALMLLGVGLLLVAVVTHYLAGRWDLLPRRSSTDRTKTE